MADPGVRQSRPAHTFVWVLALGEALAIGGIGGVLLPVGIAMAGCPPSESFRRFAAWGFPAWSFAIAGVITFIVATARVQYQWQRLGGILTCGLVWLGSVAIASSMTTCGGPP